MKSVYQFETKKRESTGRGSSRELRRQGRVPSVLYSKKLEPISFCLAENELTREYKKGAFQSKLVELKIDGKTFFALPRELQTHPVSDRIEHADFLQVDADSKIRVQVQVKVINADKSLGLKRGGTLNIVRHTVEMICSPDNIPSRLEVDVKDAQIGDSIHISAVELPKNVKPVITRDFTLVTVVGRNNKDAEEDAAASAAAAAAAPTAAAKGAAAKAPAAAAKPAAKK